MWAAFSAVENGMPIRKAAKVHGIVGATVVEMQFVQITTTRWHQKRMPPQTFFKIEKISSNPREKVKVLNTEEAFPRCSSILIF